MSENPKSADWALSVFDKASIAGEMVIGLDVTTAKRAGDALAAEVRRLREEARLAAIRRTTEQHDARVEIDRLAAREAKARELAEKFIAAHGAANSTVGQAVAATEHRDALSRWLEEGNGND